MKGHNTILDFDLTSCFSTEKFLLTLSGFYPMKNRTFFDWHNVSALFHFFISLLQEISMIVLIVMNCRNLGEVIEALLFFATHTAFLIKLTIFVTSCGKVWEIEDILNNQIFCGFTKYQLKIISDDISIITKITKVYRTLCITVTCSYLVTPFVDGSEAKSLALTGYIPYSLHNNIIFYSTHAFQVSSVAVSAYNNSAIDILNYKMVTLASSLFEILADNLRSINYKENEDRVARVWGKCITFHNVLLSYVKIIEKLFSKIVFTQFLASVLVICTTGLKLAISPIGSSQFLSSLLYFITMLFQVSLYCWFGHNVMFRSNNLAEACYVTNWYESSTKIKKCMFIFMEKVKKPTIVTAARFVPLSLATLTQILRSSYSYFAVLQRVYNE